MKKKKQARRRGQGCVFTNPGGVSWRGRYSDRSTKKLVHLTLGRTADMTIEEAREKLRQIVGHDAVQEAAILQIGHAGFVPGDFAAKATFHNRGMISELLVSADLAAKGYHVYRALSPGAPCDLVAMADSEAVRIEVKSGTRQADGRTFIPRVKKQLGRFDILAVVFKDGIIEYRKHSEIKDPSYPLDSYTSTVLSISSSYPQSEVVETTEVQ